MNRHTWMTVSEAAQYLKCSEEDIQDMVNRKGIPFSELAGSPRFHQERLDQWLLATETQPTDERENRCLLGEVEYNHNLVDRIVELSSLELEKTQRYFNLKDGRVKVQLHPPNPAKCDEAGGIEIAIPESDNETPKCKILQQVEIEDLYGNWRANSGWLTGDGTRHTFRPAVAYHIPSELDENHRHAGWKEVEDLIAYATRKRGKQPYIAYRPDAGLKFMRQCDQEDLDVLVELMTRGKDGDERIAQGLTQTELYKKYHPDHRQYWHLVAAELQTYGANSVATLFRGGKGVLYREILCDVCKKLKVKLGREEESVEDIETKLLMKILTDSMEKMDAEQLKQLVDELKLPKTSYTKQAVTASLQTAIKLGKFSSYKMALVVANGAARIILHRGLSLGANAALMKWMARFAGPIGWAITGLWTAYDIAGPAYRVITPAVIQVAYMRQKWIEQSTLAG